MELSRPLGSVVLGVFCFWDVYTLLPGYCAFEPTAWKCCLAVTPPSPLPPWNSGLVFRGPGVGLEERTVPLFKGVLASCHKAKAIKKYIFSAVVEYTYRGPSLHS